MNNAMASQAASPMNLLFGAGGQATIGKTESIGGMKPSGSFFPEMLSREKFTLPGVSPDISIPTDLQTMGQITLVLPEELLASLGIGGKEYPVLINGPKTPGEAGNFLAVNAEIMSTGDESDNNLYLRLLPTMDSETAEEMLPEQTVKTDKLIPIRLRTVEQQNGRLVGDADLLSATGKEMSVRIKLELTGTNNDFLRAMEQPETTVAGNTKNSLWSGTNLNKLMGELGVTRMVIERTDPVVSQTLPGIVNNDLFRPLAFSMSKAGQQPAGNQSSLLNTDSLMETTATSSEAVKLADVDDFFPKQGESFNQSMTGNLGKSAELLPQTGKSGLAGNPIAFDAGFETISDKSLQQSTEQPTSVRYFNLDYKLDQLKRNPGQTIRVQLIPAQLGKMDLSISAHRGSVTVSLMLDSAASKNAVEKNLAGLENRLAAAGIRVDNFQVSVNQSPRGESFTGFYQQQAYDQSRQQGGHKRSNDGRQQLKQFQNGQVDFDQVMVNYLA